MLVVGGDGVSMFRIRRFMYVHIFPHCALSYIQYLFPANATHPPTALARPYAPITPTPAPRYLGLVSNSHKQYPPSPPKSTTA